MSIQKNHSFNIFENVTERNQITVFDSIYDALQFQQGKSRKKQSPNIKCDEINIMNIINDNTIIAF